MRQQRWICGNESLQLTKVSFSHWPRHCSSSSSSDSGEGWETGGGARRWRRKWRVRMRESGGQVWSQHDVIASGEQVRAAANKRRLSPLSLVGTQTEETRNGSGKAEWIGVGKSWHRASRSHPLGASSRITRRHDNRSFSASETSSPPSEHLLSYFPNWANYLLLFLF